MRLNLGGSDSRPRKGPSVQGHTVTYATVGDRSPCINGLLVWLFHAAVQPFLHVLLTRLRVCPRAGGGMSTMGLE